MIMTGREIVLGLEDSPASLAALRWTARYASATGAVLRAVHVLDWPIGFTASATEPGTRLKVPEHEVALPYRRGMHRFAQRGPGLEVSRDGVEVGTAPGSFARDSTKAIS